MALDRNTNKHVAVKFLARNGTEFEARTIARELVNHKMCALHPHIVQLQVGGAAAHATVGNKSDKH